MLNCTSALYHGYWQLILLLETTERWQKTDFLFTQSIAVPSSLARQVEVFFSPDRWSLFQSGVLLESFCFYLSSRPYSSKYTEGRHTFNYDVTVSNGVNLCHPWLTLLAEEKQRQHPDTLARRLHSMCACRERSEVAFCLESWAVTGHKLHKRQWQTP